MSKPCIVPFVALYCTLTPCSLSLAAKFSPSSLRQSNCAVSMYAGGKKLTSSASAGEGKSGRQYVHTFLLSRAFHIGVGAKRAQPALEGVDEEHVVIC